ncbi:hypothetical protein HMSSN036_56550 [Paenibacillus macerans]|nr:hypothetical protein HMSSN036_56550 [Paenibacillus macerans]
MMIRSMASLTALANRAWKHGFVADRSGNRPAKNRGGSDILGKAEIAENFAESGHLFIQQATDRFIRRVPGRDPGSAGKQHRFDAAVGGRFAQQLANPVVIVFDDDVPGNPVTVLLQQLFDQPAAAVRFFRPRVRYCDHQA